MQLPFLVYGRVDFWVMGHGYCLMLSSLACRVVPWVGRPSGDAAFEADRDERLPPQLEKEYQDAVKQGIIHGSSCDTSSMPSVPASPDHVEPDAQKQHPSAFPLSPASAVDSQAAIGRAKPGAKWNRANALAAAKTKWNTDLLAIDAEVKKAQELDAQCMNDIQHITAENKRTFESFMGVKDTRKIVMDLALGGKHGDLDLKGVLEENGADSKSFKAKCMKVSDNFMDLVSMAGLRALPETSFTQAETKEALAAATSSAVKKKKKKALSDAIKEYRKSASDVLKEMGKAQKRQDQASQAQAKKEASDTAASKAATAAAAAHAAVSQERPPPATAFPLLEHSFSQDSALKHVEVDEWSKEKLIAALGASDGADFKAVRARSERWVGIGHGGKQCGREGARGTRGWERE